MYTAMAHFVGKTLHMRPNEILDTWGVAELIVAYGEYMNEISAKNHAEWEALDPKSRKGQEPEKVYVHFFSADDLEEE